MIRRGVGMIPGWVGMIRGISCSLCFLQACMWGFPEICLLFYILQLSIMGSFNAKLKNSDVENVKDGLHAMQGWIEAKLDRFYLEVQDELAGSGSKAIKIPVVSVVRKNRSTFVKDASIDQNKISACVRSAVGNVISGDWEDVVTDILKGALCVFLGDSETSAGGQMQVVF